MLALLIFLAGIGCYFWAVFVEMKIWNWFMPTIFSLPILSYAEMGGVAVLIGVLKFSLKKEDMQKKTTVEKATQVVSWLIVYTLSLGIAYLWRLAI